MHIDGVSYVKDIFGRWVAATEADDLTITTNELMKKASGTRADQGSFEPPRTSEETQRANGSDIDRGAMSGNTDALEPGDPNANPDGQDDDLGLDTLDGAPAEGEGDDMGAPPMDDIGMGQEEIPDQTPEQSRSIIRLQKDMSSFYQILSSMIETLGNYSAPSASADLRKIFNAAMDHLTNSKEIVLDLLTTEFTTGNYAEKLRKYVALRHVYSTVLEMLNLHFNLLDGEQKTNSIQ